MTHGSTQLYRVVYDSTATPRDALGRVVEKVETLQGITRTSRYEYDDLGRLIAVSEDGVLAEEYDYDDNGNRLSLTTPEGTTAGTYDEQDRLLGYGAFVYTYAANGELASKTDTATGEVTTYQYDALGSLLRVDLPDGRVIEYVVDGRGRRVAKKVDGVTTKRWLYRDQLNPVAELDGAGTLTWQYVYGAKPNVPDYAIRVSDGARYRVVSDQLGSVVLVVNVDDAGDVVFAGRYDAFGEQEVISGDPGWGAFGFAGGRHDAETGLVRFGARDYDPSTGRWTGKDPAGWASRAWNSYEYVASDPVNANDPLGLDELGDCLRAKNRQLFACIERCDAALAASTWLEFFSGASAKAYQSCIEACTDAENSLNGICYGIYDNPPREPAFHDWSDSCGVDWCIACR